MKPPRRLDLLAAAAVAAVGIVLYLWIARPAQFHHALQDEPPVEVVVVEVLPDLACLAAFVKPGDAQRHRATGRPVIEVLGTSERPAAEVMPGASNAREGLVRTVRMRVTAKRGSDGVLMLFDMPLKPGARLRFNPPGYAFSGTLLSVVPAGVAD